MSDRTGKNWQNVFTDKRQDRTHDSFDLSVFFRYKAINMSVIKLVVPEVDIYVESIVGSVPSFPPPPFPFLSLESALFL